MGASCGFDEYNVHDIMLGSISCTEKRLKKKRGRGRPRKNPISIHLTLLPAKAEQVDAWAAEQEDQPSRPEAIRRLVEQALSTGKKR
jgi:hypothetical protein